MNVDDDEDDEAGIVKDGGTQERTYGIGLAI
jgi:hypothetical protein